MINLKIENLLKNYIIVIITVAIVACIPSKRYNADIYNFLFFVSIVTFYFFFKRVSKIELDVVNKKLVVFYIYLFFVPKRREISLEKLKIHYKKQVSSKGSISRVISLTSGSWDLSIDYRYGLSDEDLTLLYQNLHPQCGSSINDWESKI